MHELLLAESTLERLSEELSELKDLTFVTLSADGELKRAGEPIAPQDVNLSMARVDMELVYCDQKLVFQLMEGAQKFSFVQTAVAGLDNPFFEMIVRKSDTFCNSDAQAPSIAEYVVASVMNRWHRFDIRRNLQRDHTWQENHFKQIMGSHWLIIGYGNIGQWVAKQVKGFDAQVTGIRRHVAADEHADQVLDMNSIKEILPDADVVLLSCALNDTTRGIADAAFFQAMKSDAVLVNIGRGELLDEDALIAALDQKQLDFAVLDVFQTEPLPEDSPLWDHENIQITPHASHRGSMTDQRFDQLFMANLHAYLKQEPVSNLVTADYFS